MDGKYYRPTTRLRKLQSFKVAEFQRKFFGTLLRSKDCSIKMVMSFMNPINLSDKKITLKPFLLEYSEEHLAGEDHDSVKWLSEGESTIESVQNWIKRNETSWKNDGPIFNFAIFNEENKLVGMVEANSDVNVNSRMAEGYINISYGIYPKFRGHGYATAAVNLMV